MLTVGSSMDIGDYPAGRMGRVYVFSNADEVALYKKRGLCHPSVPKPNIFSAPPALRGG